MFEVTCISYQSQIRTFNLVDTTLLMHEHRTRNSSGLLIILLGLINLDASFFHSFMTKSVQISLVKPQLHKINVIKDMTKGFYYFILFLL